MSEHFYSRARLLAGLREGLSTADWQQYAKSRKSLQVRVHKLREEGYGIANLRNATGGERPVIYKLVYEPHQPQRCPTCGRLTGDSHD